MSPGTDLATAGVRRHKDIQKMPTVAPSNPGSPSIWHSWHQIHSTLSKFGTLHPWHSWLPQHPAPRAPLAIRLGMPDTPGYSGIHTIRHPSTQYPTRLATLAPSISVTQDLPPGYQLLWYPSLGTQNLASPSYLGTQHSIPSTHGYSGTQHPESLPTLAPPAPRTSGTHHLATLATSYSGTQHPTLPVTLAPNIPGTQYAWHSQLSQHPWHPALGTPVY